MKKLFCLILSVLMLISLCPVSVFAEDIGQLSAPADPANNDPAPADPGESGGDSVPEDPVKPSTITVKTTPESGKKGTSGAKSGGSGTHGDVEFEAIGGWTIPSEGYVINTLNGETFTVSWTKTGGVTSTVLVIEIPSIGFTFETLPDSNGTTITGVRKIGENRLAIRLGEVSDATFDLTLDITLKKRSITAVEAADIIDNGIPECRFALLELEVSPDTPNTEITEELIDTLSQNPRYETVWQTCSPCFDFTEADDLQVLNTYDVTVSSDPVLTNYYLTGTIRDTGKIDDLFLDENHRTYHYRYQTRSPYDGYGLVEFTKIRVYVPVRAGESQKLTLSGVTSLAGIGVGGWVDHAREGELTDADFDAKWGQNSNGGWGVWTYTSGTDNQGRVYFDLTPSSAAGRCFNGLDMLNNASGMFRGGIGLLWNLINSNNPLSYSADAYTLYEAPVQTVLFYKAAGDSVQHELAHDGPQIRTMARDTIDKTVEYNELRRKEHTQWPFIIATDDTADFSQIGNHRVRDYLNSGSLNPIARERFPASTGPFTETFEFDYEETEGTEGIPQLLFPKSIIFRNVNQDQADSNGTPLFGGKQTTIESITYYLHNDTTAYFASPAQINSLNEALKSNTPMAPMQNTTEHTATFAFTTGDNYVTKVVVTWSSFGEMYNTIGSGPDNTLTNQVNFSFHTKDTLPTETEGRVKHTITTGSEDYVNDQYIYFRVKPAPCPDLCISDRWVNGYNGSSAPIPLADDSYSGSIGAIYFDMLQYGARRTQIKNPEIRFYGYADGATKVTVGSNSYYTSPATDIFGLGDDYYGRPNGLLFLTGRFTAAEKFVGWVIHYRTAKSGDNELTYAVDHVGVNQIPIDADDVFTSIRFTYTGDLELPYSEGDTARKWYLIYDFEFVPRTVNPYSGEEIYTLDGETAPVYYMFQYRIEDCPNDDSICDLHHPSKFLNNVPTKWGRYSYWDKNAMGNPITIYFLSHRKAPVGLGPVGSPVSEEVFQGGGNDDPAVWNIAAGAFYVGGVRNTFYSVWHGSGNTTKYNPNNEYVDAFGSAYNMFTFPWEGIGEAVYIELREPNDFIIDFENTYWLGYCAADESKMECDIVTRVDPDDPSITRTFLRLKLKNDVVREKVYYHVNSTTTPGDVVPNSGWSRWDISGRTLTRDISGKTAEGGPLSISYVTMPGVRPVTTQTESEQNPAHHPFGRIYVDFSEAAVKYTGSRDSANLTGYDNDYTKYYLQDVVEDIYNLSSTSATGAKLFEIDGSSYKVYVLRSVTSGAELRPGKSGSYDVNPRTTVFKTHERNDLNALMTIYGSQNAGSLYHMTSYVTLPRTGLDIQYPDELGNPQTQTGGNLSLYLRGAPEVLTNNTGYAVTISYTIDATPGPDSDYSYDPEAPGHSWESVTGLRFYVSEMGYDTYVNVRLDLMSNAKTSIGDLNAYAGGSYAYSSVQNSPQPTTEGLLPLCQWTYTDYLITGGHVFWDVFNEDGLKAGSGESTITGLEVELHMADGTLVDSTTTRNITSANPNGFNKALKTYSVEPGQYILIRVPDGADAVVKPAKQSSTAFYNLNTDSDFPRESVTVNNFDYVKMVISDAIHGDLDNVSCGFVKLPQIEAEDITVDVGEESDVKYVTVTEYITNTNYNPASATSSNPLSILVSGGYTLTYEVLPPHASDYATIATIEGLDDVDFVNKDSTNTMLTTAGGYKATGVAGGSYTVRATVTNSLGDAVYTDFTVTVVLPVIHITVNGNSDTREYNGASQSFTGTFTATSADAGFDPTKFSYTGTKTVSRTSVGHKDQEVAIANCVYDDDDYTIEWTAGDPISLIITKANLTITAVAKSYTYNGAAQGPTGSYTSDFATYVTADGLKGNDALSSITLAGTRTDFGTTTNGIAPSAAVVKRGSTTATGNYNISYVKADLTINKRDLTVTAKDQTYIYNGNPQGPAGTYTDGFATYVTIEGLADGDSLGSITLSGIQTEVGTYTGAIVPSAPIVNRDSAAVTNNYNFIPVNGTLKINIPPTFEIGLANDEFDYDSTAHHNRNTPTSTAVSGTTTYTYCFDENGTYVSDLSTLTKINAGTYTIHVKGQNSDYPGFVATTTATLTINKANLTITALPQTYTYNGSAQGPVGTHTENLSEYVTVQGLKGSDALYSITLAGTRTDVGTTVNGITPSAAVVKRGATDVTANYIITSSSYVKGNLTINKANLYITAKDQTYTFNNQPQGPAGTYTDNFDTYVTISGLQGTDALTSVALDGERTEVGTTVGGIVPSTAVVKRGGTAVTGNYEIHYANGDLTILHAGEFTISLGDDTYTYDGTAHHNTKTPSSTAAGTTTYGYSFTNGGPYVSSLSELTKVNAGTYTIYVEGSNPGYSTNAYTTAKLIINKRSLTVTALPQTYTYNGSSQGPAGMYTSGFATYVTVTGLAPNEELSSITLSGSQTNAQTYANEIVPSGAQIKHGSDDVTANYNFTADTYVSAPLTINKVNLTITALPQTYTYNGSAQGPVGEHTTNLAAYVTVEGLQGSDALSSITLAGTRTDVGTTTNGITPSAAVVKRGATDVTANYNITSSSYVKGNLTINKADLYITAKNQTYTFNNSPQGPAGTYTDNFDTYVTVSGLQGTDTLSSVKLTGERTAVGTTVDGIEPSDAVVERGGTAVTGNYEIHYANGDLTILLAGEFTISLADDTYTYDGTAHHNIKTPTSSAAGTTTYEYSFTNGGPYVSSLSELTKVNAGTYTIYVEGTNPGYSTHAYTTAKLIINKRSLTVTALPQTYTYNGSSQGPAGTYTSGFATYVTVTGLADNEELSSITLSGSQINAQTYANEILPSAAQIRHGSDDVTDNYNITDASYVRADLIIDPASVTLTANSAEKTYNGTLQTVSGFTASVDGLTFTGVTASGSGTNASTTPYPVTFEGVTENVTTDDSGNYVVKSITNGQLIINKHDLTITALPQTYTYNGSAQGPVGEHTTNLATYVTIAGLQGSDALYSITLAGTRTDVGTTANGITPSAAIVKRGATDVTANYNITSSSYAKGNLTINKADLYITAKDQTYTFNNQPQGPAGTYTDNFDTYVTISGLQGTDALTSVALDGERTEVGTTVGGIVPSTAVVKRGGTAVTGNYEIHYANGDLTILHAGEFTISLDDDTYTYDGTAHHNTKTPSSSAAGTTTFGYSFTNGGPYESDLSSLTKVDAGTYTIYVEGTNPGYGTNAYTTAKLIINKRSLTVTALPQTYTYNGSSQGPAGTYTSGFATYVTVTGLAPNEELSSITLSGSQTNAQTYANEILPSAAQIRHGSTDVTDNYNITDASYVRADLIIDPASVTLTANSDEKTYNGAEQTVTGFSSSVDGLTFTGVSASGSGTNASTTPYPVTFTGVTVGTTKDTTGNYVVTAVNDGTLTINRANLTITSKDQTYTFNGNPQGPAGTYTSGFDAFVTLTGLQGTDALNSVKLSGSRTLVGTYTGEIVPSDVVIKRGGIDVTGNYNVIPANGTLTIDPSAEFFISLAGDEYDYDGTAHHNANTPVSMALTGTTTFKFSFEQNGTYVDDLTTLTKVNAGVYTIYVKATNPNYSGTATATATLKINPAKVQLTSGSKTRQYNGIALTNADVEGKNANELTVESGWIGNDGATYTFTGTITKSGSVKNAFTYTFKEGTLESNYDITKTEGDLTIEKNSTAVDVTAGSGSKTYDGTPLTKGAAEDFTVTGLPAGFTWTAAADGTVTNVIPGDGEKAENSVSSFRIFDAQGEDVTDQFTGISTHAGTLTVAKAPVTLTSGSKTRQYNGIALTNTEVEGKNASGLTVESGWIGNEGATYNFTGTITKAGTVKNVFSYALKEGTIESNYNIVKTEGDLTIEKNSTAINVTAGSGSKTYDGTPLTKGEPADFTVTGLPDGFTWTAVADGTVTNVIPGDGEKAENSVTEFKIFDAQGEDVTDQFTGVNTHSGTLSVTKATVTLTSGSKMRQYNGSALTNFEVEGKNANGLTVEIGWVGNEGATYKFSGTITKEGTVKNAFSYTLKPGTLASNYDIVKAEGDLTVEKNTTQIDVTGGSGTKVYDGTPLTKNEHDDFTVEGLPEGFTWTAEADGTVTNVTPGDGEKAENSVTSFKIYDAQGNDVTDQFTGIVTHSGTLTVTKAKLRIRAIDQSYVYNGALQGEDNATYTSDFEAKITWLGLRECDVISSVTLNGRELNAGTYEGKIVPSGVTIRKNTRSVAPDPTDNYEITYVGGKLTITKAPLTIRANDMEYVFNGEFRGPEGSYTSGFGAYVTTTGLKGSDVLTGITLTGREKAIGVYADRIVPSEAVIGDATGNYSITYLPGRLTIFREVSPQTGDDSRTTLWATILVASALGMGGCAWIPMRKRKRS